jgi:hypothetical protein
MEQAASYCQVCHDYTMRIPQTDAGELKQLRRLRNSARSAARRAARYDDDAMELCRACDYRTPKIDNLFYARKPIDRYAN